jgi:rhamnogalacturonan acetylesterase
MKFIHLLALLGATLGPLRAAEIPLGAPVEPAQHPALFLVGDSVMKTGAGDGERGAWGWGYELGAFFDATKIHIYNEGRGGRSSRGYIEEGAWAGILAQLQPGDFVIVQFGHNDTANSANYPDRSTINSGGEETVQVGVSDQKKVIHTFGWYLRRYVTEGRAKGATVILCSPVPRSQWAGGKIKRGFDGYARWAAEAAQATGAGFIDLNALAADRYDALGQEEAKKYFNDVQHTTKLGARVNAECVIEGIKRLSDSALKTALK